MEIKERTAEEEYEVQVEIYSGIAENWFIEDDMSRESIRRELISNGIKSVDAAKIATFVTTDLKLKIRKFSHQFCEAFSFKPTSRTAATCAGGLVLIFGILVSFITPVLFYGLILYGIGIIIKGMQN